MKGTAIFTCVLLLQQYPCLHAAPPIESCPHDSVQVEGTCKCDPKLCTKPPCQYELNVAVNGTDTPGTCCTIYSCDGCSNDTLVQDKCPCAPGAILNAKGECRCVDPHQKLTNNECVCDPNLCELPQLCGENYVSVTEQEGCCSKTKCIKCPDDSFATTNNDEAVEDKCVCYPCRDKECGPNERVVIIQRGNGFPETCCDIYRCEELQDVEQKCVAEEVVYGDGETWNTPDGQSCKCQAGIAFCTKQNEENFHSCHQEGSVYKHNESWMLDSCTNCTCVNGETKCIAHMCEVSEGHLKKPECQPLNCSKVCPDGYRLNKRGCKICKCNYPYKYDDILQKYNLTKIQLKDILEDYFANNRDETNIISTTTIATNVSDEYQHTDLLNDSDGCRLWNVFIWISVGFAIGTVLTLLIWTVSRCNQRKKGSHDIMPTDTTATYERMNLTKDGLNNNYIGNEHKSGHKIKGSV